MSYSLTICSLGSGDERDLTMRITDALQAGTLILRTEQHPVARWLKSKKIPFTSLDCLYEQAESFDDFNCSATNAVWESCRLQDTCYAVSDIEFDSTVSEILKTAGTRKVTLLAGVSHSSRCLSVIGEVPVGIRVFSAEDYLKARAVPQENLLITELHSAVCAGECKLRLMKMISEETTVRMIFGNSETGDLSCKKVPLYELDRQKGYDHLTAVYIQGTGYLERSRYDSEDLRQIIHRLRAPGGCPWDREQTHESLLQSLLEESWEFIQAVRDHDTDHMYDELGDVLLQVYMQSEIARQHGTFDIDDVTTAIAGKMLERHPHVFGNGNANTSEDVLKNWEALKRKQRGLSTTAQAMKDVSCGLSTLLRASKIQHKAQKVGFDFADAKEAMSKVTEEAQEVLQNLQSGEDPQMELGDLLFAVVNVCRLCGKDADLALNAATEKFMNRFEKVENAIISEGKSLKDLTLSEMDVYWNAVKRGE